MLSQTEIDRLFAQTNEFQQATYRALQAGSADANQQRAAAAGIVLERALNPSVRRTISMLLDVIGTLQENDGTMTVGEAERVASLRMSWAAACSATAPADGDKGDASK